MQEDIWAILRARKGSKRVPRKNIRLLGNKPLMCYVAEAALSSPKIKRVSMITDDEEVAKICNKYYIEVINEPPELAQAGTAILDVIKYALNQDISKGRNPYILLPLQLTSPFVKSKQIDEAIDLLITTNADSIVGIKKVSERPEWMYRKNPEGKLEKIMNQDLLGSYNAPEIFTLNGAMYVAKAKSFLGFPTYVFGGDIRGYVMDDISSIDIDTELDFKIAEMVLREGLFKP